MQTLKTASIVGLLLTVMYGGYVSLTTPPEQIPAEYADLLVIDDNLGMESGIDGGMLQAPEMAIDSMGQQQPQSFGASFPEPSLTTPAMTSGPSMGLPSSTPSTSISLGPAQGTTSSLSAPNNSTLNAPRNPQPAKLPSVTVPARNVSVELNGNYPATSRDFAMPTPESSSSSFDPGTGQAFVAPGSANTPDAMSLPSIDELPTSSGQRQAVDIPQTQLTKDVSLGPTSAQQSAPPAAQQDAPSAAADLAAGTIQRGAKNLGLENAIKIADRQYHNDQIREALATLSVFYNTPNLIDSQRDAMLARLDPLARDVIYSQRHILEQPHRVGTNETLMEIAESYRVPWQLLANINGIRDPLVTPPGTELKVVRGPFSAQVDLQNEELTLFLGDLYAGRFPIKAGSSPMPRPGTFTVQDKQSRRPFQDGLGNPIPGGAPGNPYGKVWIDLGSQLCIHGSPSPTSPTDQGCISLSGELADDLFGILSQGSSVTIRR